jgi:hypothetical protein
MFGDVHDPQLVGLFGVERSVDKIIVDVAVAGPGAAPVSFAVVNPDRPTCPHQTLTGCFRSADPAAEPELGSDPWRPIAMPRHLPNIVDLIGGVRFSQFTICDWLAFTLIEPRC